MRTVYHAHQHHLFMMQALWTSRPFGRPGRGILPNSLIAHSWLSTTMGPAQTAFSPTPNYLREARIHVSPPAARCAASSISKAGLHLTWSDQTYCFDAAWLYHNAPRHRDAHSGQIIIPVEELRDLASLRVSSARLIGDESVSVQFSNGQAHTYDVGWLLANHGPWVGKLNSSAEVQRTVPLAVHLGTKTIVPRFSFSDVSSSDDALLHMLHAINQHGLVLVTGAGTSDGTVLRLAERIAPPMPTIYGLSWDVVSSPAPINIAYTSQALDLHQDLAYYESPPGLQALHCRQFAPCVTGGESTFMDALAMAEAFREAHPREFATLCSVPATFQKVREAHPRGPTQPCLVC